MVVAGSTNAHGIGPAVCTIQDQLEREFRWFLRMSFALFICALFAFIGLMYLLVPLAPDFQHFFRNRIGGILGECLLGLSIPFLASPPVFAFLIWMCLRANRPAMKCPSCNYSFASTTRFGHVRRTGECPACNVRLFKVAEASDSEPMSYDALIQRRRHVAIASVIRIMKGGIKPTQAN